MNVFVVCSLFINTNCSHKAGLQVQRNTLINNTMCIMKRYKIFKPISINNNLVLKLVPYIVFWFIINQQPLTYGKQWVARLNAFHEIDARLSPMSFQWRKAGLTQCFLVRYSRQNKIIDNVKWYMKCFIYRIADVKSSKLWSSQLWTQFKQLRI